jgi:hypothetical protein
MMVMKSKIGVDFIYNGSGGLEASGDVADRLIEYDGDIGPLRPWRGRNGRSYMSVRNRNGQRRTRVCNAPATLPKESWIDIDQTLLRVARPELRVWGDLEGAGLIYTPPGGLGTTMIQEYTINDVGQAVISMDPVRQSEQDRPLTDYRNFPIPVIHGDFGFTLRQILASQQARAGRAVMPLDTTMLEMVTRRVAETVEKFTLGTIASYSYGGGTVYGITNKPQRYTKTMTLPTAAGWTPQTTYEEILDMIQTLADGEFNGPYGLYFSRAWARYFNVDYSDAYPNATLRTKLRDVDDIGWMRRVSVLTGYQIILWQPSSSVIRGIRTMPIRAMQWDTAGGMARRYKVLCAMVPQVRSDARDLTGINHGVAA